MKIIAVSDSHNLHRELTIPKGDIFIHCGDITMQGELDVLLDFNDWLGELDFDYKVVIAGNHDYSLAKDPTLAYKLLTNCIYLENSGVEIEGLKFWGSPSTPWPAQLARYFAFGNARDEASSWRVMPKKIDVLVTHSPPYGILDLAIQRQIDLGIKYKLDWGDLDLGIKYKLDWGDHCGDGILAGKVIERKPKLHFFGHIHESYGSFESDYGTKFYNCSVLDERYKLVNKPTILNI